MPPQPPIFSWVVFLTLLVICGSSLVMFLLLVRRWTTQRQWVSLAEWARQREFRFRPKRRMDLPPPLESLRNSNVRIRMYLSGEGVDILQLETQAIADTLQPNRWNVLARRRVKRHAAPAGLRPANAPGSLLDLYGLSQFPSLAVGHRFALLATSSSSAHALADSASRTLLPADLGMLLIDDWIVLDFSARPFDPIELDRVIGLAQQLSLML